LDYRLEASLPSGFSKQVPLTLKGDLKGTWDAPVIHLDAAALAKQVTIPLADSLLRRLTGKGVEETVDKAKVEIEQQVESVENKARQEAQKKAAEAERKIREQLRQKILKK
jgi:F0F1-type ATP synthase membrane subunit b/b'